MEKYCGDGANYFQYRVTVWETPQTATVGPRSQSLAAWNADKSIRSELRPAALQSSLVGGLV